MKPVSAISVAIFNGIARQAYFDLEASTDGLSWTKLLSGESSGTNAQLETYLIAATGAKYIRLNSSGNSSNNNNSITEVAIYGPPSVTGVEIDRGVEPECPLDFSRTSIAAVDAAGSITAAGEGRTTVSAVTEDGGFTPSASVTVDLNGPRLTVTLDGASRHVDESD